MKLTEYQEKIVLVYFSHNLVYVAKERLKTMTLELNDLVELRGFKNVN